MRARSLVFASVCLASFASTDALAQNAEDVINMFGTIMRAAMVDHARAEWTKVSQNELSCVEQGLKQQGTSIDNSIQNGVDPNDPRISALRSGCRPQRATSTAPLPDIQRTQAPHEQKSPYLVDGIVLGGRVQLDDDAYKQYQCEPSQQYPGFTRCDWNRSSDDSESMLHAPDGTVMYVNRYIEPASFKPNEINAEIDRLAQKFGASPKLIRMPHRPDLPDALIAIWGDLTLQPLEQDSISTLASGNSPGKGMLVDFLGHFSQSARTGLPVYSVSGGAGYVWSVSYDKKRKGTLRFFAMDPSAAHADVAQVPNGGERGGPVPLTQPQPPQPPKDTKRLKEARMFMDDAKTFIADQKSVPSISVIAKEAANLQIALDKFDEPAALQSMKKLGDLLKPINGFDDFQALQQAERQREGARQLAEAKNDAAENILFIDGYSKAHLGDAKTATLLALREQIDSSVKRNTIDDMIKANDAVGIYVKDNKLSDEYETARKNFLNPKLRSVVEGPSDDIVISYNASATAPSVWKNAKGDIAFQNDLDKKSEEWWNQKFSEMPGQYWAENETAAQCMKKMYEAEGKDYKDIWGEDPDPKESSASGASSLKRPGPKNKGRPR
jgi:hypothetical protein